jgi:hypothetical protein
LIAIALPLPEPWTGKSFMAGPLNPREDFSVFA